MHLPYPKADCNDAVALRGGSGEKDSLLEQCRL